MANLSSAVLAIMVWQLSLPDTNASQDVRASNATELADAIASRDDGWSVTAAGYGGPASGNWSYAIVKPVPATDYTVEAQLVLVKNADRRDGTENSAYAVYRAHADLGGYEAAVAVRYESPLRHYRVAVSSLWQEIIVWRPSGGVVQVKPYPFQAGKTYRIQVRCRGPHIEVDVDGTKQIDWWDTADPVLGGTAALARKEGESYFTSLTVARADRATETPPRHTPRFHEQKWHDARWFFDGTEPLFTLRDDNVLDHMKLRPGYRAAMYAYNFVTDWAAFYPSQITKYRVVEAGDRLVIETSGVDRNKSNGIECHARLEVTYDAAREAYQYEHACTVPIHDAVTKDVADHWDHGDAVFLGSVGSAQTRDPLAARPLYDWSVFESPDGKHFKVPHNHNGHYLGTASTNGGPMRPNGGQVIAVGDPVLSPVIEFGPKSSQFGTCAVGLCWWAYDVHTNFVVDRVNGVVPAGTYVSTVRYTAVSAPEANALFERSEFYHPVDTQVTIPVFTAGVGHTEPFDREVVLATPHREHRIWGGTFDRQVGRSDRSSLRLDGPSQAWTLTGPSYFVAPYGKRNRVSAWVKTRDASGQGPTIGLRRLDNNTAEFHATGITGTTDWTHVSYVTDFPGDSFGVMVYFRNSGGGTVWFDDFRIEPIDDAASPSVARLPPSAAGSDVLLEWTADGDTTSILDRSAYGHHGRLYGSARWADDSGRRVLELDGNGYVWPLTSPRLTLGPDTTMLMEIKPEAEGALVWWGFQFTISTVGQGPEQAIEYRPSGGAPIRSRLFLKTGQWQKLAIVARKDRIDLYQDGLMADELKVTPLAGNWSLHDQSTWHRHLSFFGGGPGNMALVPENPALCWKGRVRSLTILDRAVTADELRQRGTAAER